MRTPSAVALLFLLLHLAFSAAATTKTKATSSEAAAAATAWARKLHWRAARDRLMEKRNGGRGGGLHGSKAGGNTTSAEAAASAVAWARKLRWRAARDQWLQKHNTSTLKYVRKGNKTQLMYFKGGSNRTRLKMHGVGRHRKGFAKGNRSRVVKWHNKSRVVKWHNRSRHVVKWHNRSHVVKWHNRSNAVRWHQGKGRGNRTRVRLARGNRTRLARGNRTRLARGNRTRVARGNRTRLRHRNRTSGGGAAAAAGGATPRKPKTELSNQTLGKLAAALKAARNKTRPAPSRLERSIAFFGAVDSRPHLFLQVIALHSVRRFHPGAGYFVLLPEAAAADRNWTSLLDVWSNGRVQPLALPAESVRLHFRGRVGGYSSMTFHRHRVPEMLFARGYKYSVNLDPDVFCTRPWDLSVFPRIELLGGRAVGRNARTAVWLAAKQKLWAQKGTGAPTIEQRENVSAAMYRLFNVTDERMEATDEVNGGVLIFNNSAAKRVDWGSTMARYHDKLRHVVEGDQDLVSLVFAAEPSFQRYLLPTTYNYAYRRDRERLPYTVGHRLRHGLIEQQIINVHFVADGKPWQRQQLDAYPLWLLAARLHHLRDWLNVARSIQPKLDSGKVQLTPSERANLGAALFDALRNTTTLTRRNGSSTHRYRLPASLVDADSSRRCRCFMRSLSRDKKADALELLAGGVEMPKAVAAAAYSIVRRQRNALFAACGGFRAGPVSDEERSLCNLELGARTAVFRCALSAAQRAGTEHRAALSANCSRSAETAAAALQEAELLQRPPAAATNDTTTPQAAAANATLSPRVFNYSSANASASQPPSSIKARPPPRINATRPPPPPVRVNASSRPASSSGLSGLRWLANRVG